MFGMVGMAANALGTSKVRENQPFVKDSGSQNDKYNTYKKDNFFSNFGNVFGKNAGNLFNNTKDNIKNKQSNKFWQPNNSNTVPVGYLAHTLAEKALYE